PFSTWGWISSLLTWVFEKVVPVSIDLLQVYNAETTLFPDLFSTLNWPASKYARPIFEYFTTVKYSGSGRRSLIVALVTAIPAGRTARLEKLAWGSFQVRLPKYAARV